MISTQGTTIPLRIVNGELLFQSSGRIDRWPAPSLRGATIRTLRDRYCRFPETGSSSTSQLKTSEADGDRPAYCQGCTYNAECAYGRNFEPDRMMIAGQYSLGCRDGVRPITIGSGVFPTRNQTVQAGDRLPVRLMFLGNQAIELQDEVVHDVQTAGSARGITPDRIRFELIPQADSGDTVAISKLSLLQQFGTDAVHPRVRIRLTSPLFLKQRSDRQKSDKRYDSRRSYSNGIDAHPNFPVLWRESVRLVRRVLDEYGDGTSDFLSINYSTLVAAGESIHAGGIHFASFQRERGSSRQSRRWQMRGWFGDATFENVPQWMMPWLELAGRLGVGDSRNCGAGQFAVGVDHACARTTL